MDTQSENEAYFNDMWEKVKKESNRSENETPEEATKRNISQNVARAGEFFVGYPGSIKKSVQDTYRQLEKLYFGEEGEGLKEYSSKERDLTKESATNILMNPPTSEQVRENVTKPLSKKLLDDEEYLEPKNEMEKATGEFVQDFASFFTPGSNKSRLAMKVGIPLVGNLAKHGAKYLGVSDSNADKLKLGTMLVANVASRSNPGRFASNRIQDAKNMVPENTMIDARNIQNNLTNIENRLSRGLNVPSKSNARSGIQQLREQINNGEIGAHNLMAARDNINEWIAEAGGWDVPVPVRDASIRNLNELKSSIINNLENGLGATHPEALNLYRTGYQAAAVTHQSNAISNFIEKNFGRKFASAGAKIAFPSVAGGAILSPKAGVIAATTYPLYKTGQVMYRISNSPTLTQYYADIVRHSLAENGPAMIKSMSKFDEEMKKVEIKESAQNKMEWKDFKKEFGF